MTDDLERIFDRVSTRLNDHLCEMKPSYDDSIVGFNEAWDIVRAVFKDELAKDRPQSGVQTEDAAAIPATCAICGERDYPTRRSRCEHPACPPIPDVAATPSDKEIGKQIGAYLGMSGIDAGDVAHIRNLVMPGNAQRTLPTCVHAICDDTEWCTGEPICRYGDAQASLNAVHKALFEPDESDAIDNLDGALIDIKRFSEQGKPTDQVCIQTIERVQAQLLAVHALCKVSTVSSTNRETAQDDIDAEESGDRR